MLIVIVLSVAVVVVVSLLKQALEYQRSRGDYVTRERLMSRIIQTCLDCKLLVVLYKYLQLTHRQSLMFCY